MTFLTPFIVATTFAATTLAANPQPDCSRPAVRSEQRVFTNADLERVAACRYQTGVQSEIGAPASEKASKAPPSSSRGAVPPETSEASWRSQWRTVDQKVRRLRREAQELRQEAAEAPRDPKKKPTGRRSSALLVTRARSLEAEALELEEEFQERARREGALPGWLRPAAR